MNILINLLVFLVLLAVLYLIMHLFRTYVQPIDQRVVNIIFFIAIVLMLIYALTGHGLFHWRY